MSNINSKPLKTLGERIKSLRKSKGLTQAQLSYEICTQGLISSLENGTGKENPSALTVYQLSERLGVSMGYLYGQKKEEFSYDIRKTEIGDIIHTLKARRDYTTLIYLIKIEKEKKRALNKAEKQFLLWHETVAEYYLNKDFKKTLGDFNELMQLQVEETDENKNQLIEIELSLGLILFEEGDYEKAEVALMNCLSEIQANPGVINDKTITKIYFNLSVIYTKNSRYEESLEYCNKAIDLCKLNDSMTLLGDSLYQTGYNYCLMNDFSTGISYIRQSIVIFQIQGNDKLVKIIQKYLASVVPKSSDI
ncbi:helix-turn-helix transcriptional regulator [Shouchella sp. 1P09AA]|uniref:helix-turn-helix domain-containing protein n=1 Tax=unclassified Shouchella TaxID=2893065 RepID=UPI0039A2841C